MNAAIVGHVDSLGYLFCQECKPVPDAAYAVIWSDSGPHNAEDCEMCHRPLSLTGPTCKHSIYDPGTLTEACALPLHHTGDHAAAA